MSEFFEVIINTDLENFGEWFGKYIPESGKDVFIIRGKKVPEKSKDKQELVYKDKYIKIIGLPIKEVIGGNERYSITTISGTMESITTTKGFNNKYPIIMATQLEKNITKLIINTQHEELEVYIDNLLSKIQKIWPESRRYLLKDYCSPYPLKENPLVFDMTVRADEDEIINLIKSNLVEHGVICDFLLQNDHLYESKYFNIEYFPATQFDNSVELLYLLRTDEYQENESSRKNEIIRTSQEWVLFQIVLEPNPCGSYHLKFYQLADAEQFDAITDKLENIIKFSFPPNQKSSDKQKFTQHTKKEKEDIYFPKSLMPLSKWRTVWELIKSDWYETADLASCLAKISDNLSFVYSDSTVRKIIIAGEAGKLDMD
jgi:hypothetical protein